MACCRDPARILVNNHTLDWRWRQAVTIVSIRPWREPIQGLVKNHSFVIFLFWTRHGTDHFLGAKYWHRGGSNSAFLDTALILMDEWSGSTQIRFNSTLKKVRVLTKQAGRTAAKSSSKKEFEYLLWRGVFSLDKSFNGRILGPYFYKRTLIPLSWR